MWTWLKDTAKRFWNTATGQEPSPDDLRAWSQESLNGAASEASALTGPLSEGTLSLGDWQQGMRDDVKSEYIQQYLLGIGGEGQMTSEHWGSVGGMIAEQYRYLDNFAREIAGGQLSAGRIAARSGMYLQSAGEAFSRAFTRSQGWPVLPAYPRDGSTQCLCITTPESEVLTSTGWRPLAEVVVGDLVLTHRNRWRPVTDIVVKQSEPYHRQAWLKADGYGLVGCTHDHLWYTPDGWMNSTNIDKLETLVYRLIKGTPPLIPLVRKSEVNILFGEMLPGGTALWDLSVEEDHSFVIEGLIAHNTNCRCYWECEKRWVLGYRWECYWRLSEAEHCPDCVDRAADWAPLRLPA